MFLLIFSGVVGYGNLCLNLGLNHFLRNHYFNYEESPKPKLFFLTVFCM
ncbi:hypothetical protein SPHINGO8BC_80114 [Sphingobacterium multivorum]|uniref:Uncharacterized protein n=1 Tax=Sphingobacterium multivorum TaxID=28454 RepID=A0A654DMM8_SPHMU|nr:hypothetical protein SPHINGO8BC_80114 [Sphingobacterium multivorum]